MDDTANANNRANNRPTDRTAAGGAAGGAHVANAGIRPIHSRAMSTPLGGGWRSTPNTPVRPTERTQLARSYSTADVEGSAGESMEYTGSGPVAGGTIMGIHNLAIVFPQFIASQVPIYTS